MQFRSVCITTNNAPRLADFYAAVFLASPQIDGSHYAFGNLSVWDPGDVQTADCNNTWLTFSDGNIDALYARLLRSIPDIRILVPPERKPWGAYAFWFLDPDGNKISVFQE